MSLVLTFVAAAPAPAQRAACTGIVRDPRGVPIAAAQVTFVQEASQALGGVPDRVEVRSDEYGAFAADLLLGSPYVVWAIGARQANGEHWITGAAMQAAGGKEIELRANRRAGPRAITVRGVSPWVADAPPALRVLVGGQYACGLDVVLPGDGVVRLGPWPDEPVEIALLDGDGQILDSAKLDEAAPVSVTFTPTRQFECHVAEPDGTPIAGAAIWMPAQSPSWLWGCDPLPVCFVGSWRRAGVTDVSGHVTIQVPWPEKEDARSFRLLASCAGYAADMDGIMGGRRLLGRRGEQRDEGSFQFRLPKRDATTMRIDAEPVGVAAITLAKGHFFQFASGGGGSADLFVPAAIEGENARPSSFELPDGIGGVFAYLRPRTIAANAPTRLVVGLLGVNAPPPAFDIANLREHRLVFIDLDDQPVPFVHVVVGVPTRGYPRRWYDRCVADAEGVVTMRAAGADWLVLATDGTRVWSDRISAKDTGGPMRLIGSPVPTLSLRCVDAAGEGLPGVGVAVDCWPRVETHIHRDDWRTAGLAQVAGALLRTVRSNHVGKLVVPLPAGPVTEVVFRRGALQSKSFRLATDEKLDPIVLK